MIGHGKVHWIAPAVAAVLSGCSVEHSALRTSGTGADRIAALIFIFTAVSLLVWLAVLATLAIAVRRQRQEHAGPPLVDLPARRAATRIVSAAVGVTVVVIVALTALSYFAGKSIADIGLDEPLTIRLTGHDWWWEIRYEDRLPERVFETANEIHVPVGQPVRMGLAAADVIHSFWVPSLAGKMDLIPGRDNSTTIIAEHPGVYRGQCAEYCGYQHAHMNILVVADPPQDFVAWREAELKPAADVTANDPGRQIFLSRGCQLCHAIRETPAVSRVGPELTHFGSQRTLAADTLPLTHSNLVAWIADPQKIKPGCNMPAIGLSGAEREAVAAYLERLK